MNELIHIGNADISVKEYNGQRVVTFKDIDMVHGRPEGTANKRFLDNKNRFVEGEDYFIVSNSEIRKSQLFPISDNDFTNKALITEQGYLMLVKSFTDDLAWQVQRQIVSSYFRKRKITSDELSPQTQLLMQLVQSIASKELEDKERDRQIALANETARKAVETTESIKEAVRPIVDNWREEINLKINRIQKSTGIPFNTLRGDMYKELEQRAGCDLGTRLRNKRQRMMDSGCTKTEINNANKMDIIEEEKRFKIIFEKIVSEYEVKYCV